MKNLFRKLSSPLMRVFCSPGGHDFLDKKSLMAADYVRLYHTEPFEVSN